MERTYFSKTEAEEMLGKRMQVVVELADVPVGTSGQVNGWQEAEQIGDYRVIVDFDSVLTTQPILKWLSKVNFSHLVQEVE